MSGVIFETEIHKFASKYYCEVQDLCLFFIISSCENAVLMRNVLKPLLISNNSSFAAHEIWSYFKEIEYGLFTQSCSLFFFK